MLNSLCAIFSIYGGGLRDERSDESAVDYSVTTLQNSVTNSHQKSSKVTASSTHTLNNSSELQGNIV